MKKIKFKIQKTTIIIIILSILNLLVIGNFCIMCFNNTLPAKEHIYYELPITHTYYEITPEQSVELAKQCVGVYSFKLTYADYLGDTTLGNVNIFTRRVKIKKDLDPFYQLGVLVHELVHIKYYTTNERFTEFTAFRLMYESENEIIHNAGIYYVERALFHTNEYDISWYVVDYFQKK